MTEWLNWTDWDIPSYKEQQKKLEKRKKDIQEKWQENQSDSVSKKKKPAYVKQIANGNLLYVSGTQTRALEGLDGEEGGREVQERGDICVPMANSCWCVAETNTIL